MIAPLAEASTGRRPTSPRKVSLVSATEESQPLPPSGLPRASAGVTGRLKRDAALAVATGFAIQAVLILTGTLVARMLGPDGRGYLAALILWPWVITLFGNLGIPSALTYAIARDSSASQDARALGPGLRASPGAAPDGAPGPLAAGDPAWRPSRGPRRRMADARRLSRRCSRSNTAWGCCRAISAAALQRVAPLALGALRAWRRRALRSWERTRSCRSSACSWPGS